MPSPGNLPTIVESPRSPQLIGRDQELAELQAQIERSRSGSLRVVLIEGAAGIGKTRLIAESLARNADGVTCLSSRGHRWGYTTSFGLWVEALDRSLRDRSEKDLRRLCGTSLDDLAVLLKPIEPVAPRSGSQPRRGRLLEGLVDLFDRLSAEAPVLLGLDDVHLADASSWETLRYLGRRLSEAPIAVLATTRPAELRGNKVATEVLLALSEEGLLHRIGLKPLTYEAVASLAHAILRSERPAAPIVRHALVSWLLERSLGHPLFVVSLLRALLDEQADLAAPRLERIPETLQDRVELELTNLDAADRKLLEILAVVDRRIELGDLVAISGRPAEEVGVSLERLCQSQLVAEHETEADLRHEVAHPLIQDTIYQGIGGARRRILHRSVARTFLESGQVGVAAAHFARSAERGDDEVVAALCEATGQAEERGLYQEALATLAALLDLLPPGDKRWLQVLAAMDWQAEWVIGHLAEGDVSVAVAAMERIRPLVEEEGDLLSQGTVNFHLAAFLSIGGGQFDEAERACRRAIELFEAAGEHEPALFARNELAWIHACEGDLGRAAAQAEEVATEAEASGHVRAAVHAWGSRGYVLSRTGQFDEAKECLRRSVELAQPNADTYRVAWGRNQLGVLLSLSGSPKEARASIERALREVPNAPDSGTLEYLAHADWLRGRLESCVGWVQQSEIRRSMRGSRRRAWALAVAARAYGEMGQHARARRQIDRARVTYEGRQILDWAWWCDWTEGFLARVNGEHNRALAALQRAADWLAGMEAVVYEALVLVDMAEVAADARDGGRVEAVARRLSEISSEVGGELHPSLALVAEAWSHLFKGHSEEAREAAEWAWRHLSETGYEFYAACAQEIRGRAMERKNSGEAIEVLAGASQSFDQCGAVWRRDRVVGRLDSLGSRGRRAAAGVLGPQALTDRERDIVVLATEGYTARETGERLFISRRTVETHLASIYAKLDVNSKRELVRRTEELGL